MNVNPVPGMSILKKSSAIILILMLLVTSCRKESTKVAQNAVPSGLKMISSSYAQGAAIQVVVYAQADPYVGYNRLYIALYDSITGSPITQASVSLSAGMGSLAAPIENPATASTSTGLYTAAATFVTAGSWVLVTSVQNTANGKTGSCAGTVSVTQVSPAKSYSLTTADSSNIFVSIVQPADPQLGINTFELVVYKQKGSSNYLADSTYMLDINPTMPGMTGMSSPNNVNPGYQGNGHYIGKVDFIMSGEWWIYVDLIHDGSIADTSHYFDLSPKY